MSDENDEVAELTEAISKCLAQKDPTIIASALTDIMATFLAGFVGPTADSVRKQIMKDFTSLVWELVPLHERRLMEALIDENGPPN